MSADDIHIYGDPVLRQKAKQIEIFDDSFKALVEETFAVMFEADGIGLAATQLAIMKSFLVIGMPGKPGAGKTLLRQPGDSRSTGRKHA